jgi:hypothetical protein
MRWIVTLVLLAVFSMSSAPSVNADEKISVYPEASQYPPTTPQVPAPQAEVVRSPETPSKAVPGQVAGNCNSPCNSCTNKKNCVQKFYAWITYRPSAGDALPLLKVPPYTGPYTGTFLCTSTPGSTCAGNGSPSCGKKQGCASGNPPASVSSVTRPVNPGLGAMNLVPPVAQGYPSRGCQGGSVQLSDPSFPGSAHAVPLNPDSSNNGEAAIPVENVDFKPVSCNSSRDASGSQADFIAAVLVSRQVQTPMELLARSNLRP